MLDERAWARVFIPAARVLADVRGTCERLRVGCFITSADHQRVLGMGYNGGHAGGPNACDDPTIKGGCGCLHAEANALFKAGAGERDKIIYVTHAPCKMCAKAIVNSGASQVVYGHPYTYTEGLDILHGAGVITLEVSL